MQNTLLLLCPALLLCPCLMGEAPAPSPAPSIDQLLARHLQALGGAQAVHAPQSRRSRCTLQGLAPFDVPVLVEQTRAGRYRREVRIQDTLQITAFDGRAGWKLDPFSGSDAVQPLQGEELKDLLEQSDFDGDLVDAAAKGHSLRYLGLETLPTGPAHKLQLTRRDGRDATVFLDAASGLEVQRVETRPQMGQPVTLEIRFSDYRAVGGVKQPFLTSIRPQGAAQGLRIRTDSVELDPALPEARFQRP